MSKTDKRLVTEMRLAEVGVSLDDLLASDQPHHGVTTTIFIAIRELLNPKTIKRWRDAKED